MASDQVCNFSCPPLLALPTLTVVPKQVHPLRIAKGSTPKSSPTKVSGGLPRPLSELSPTEKRRNSPSWFQASPKVSGGMFPRRSRLFPFSFHPLFLFLCCGSSSHLANLYLYRIVEVGAQQRLISIPVVARGFGLLSQALLAESQFGECAI